MNPSQWAGATDAHLMQIAAGTIARLAALVETAFIVLDIDRDDEQEQWMVADLSAELHARGSSA